MPRRNGSIPRKNRSFFSPPEPRFDEVEGPGEGRTQNQRPDFGQWIQNFTKLAGILKTGEVVQKRRARPAEGVGR
jgi:hypothetical protein